MDRLKSRKFGVIIVTSLLNAGLLIAGQIEAAHFVTLQSAAIPAWLLGQSYVDSRK